MDQALTCYCSYFIRCQGCLAWVCLALTFPVWVVLTSSSQPLWLFARMFSLIKGSLLQGLRNDWPEEQPSASDYRKWWPYSPALWYWAVFHAGFIGSQHISVLMAFGGVMLSNATFTGQSSLPCLTSLFPSLWFLGSPPKINYWPSKPLHWVYICRVSHVA